MKKLLLPIIVSALAFSSCSNSAKNAFTFTVSGYNNQTYSFSDYATPAKTGVSPVCYFSADQDGAYFFTLRDIQISGGILKIANAISFWCPSVITSSAANDRPVDLYISGVHLPISSTSVIITITSTSTRGINGYFLGSGMLGASRVNFSGTFSNMISL